MRHTDSPGSAPREDMGAGCCQGCHRFLRPEGSLVLRSSLLTYLQYNFYNNVHAVTHAMCVTCYERR